jgi:hypothetical protein
VVPLAPGQCGPGHRVRVRRPGHRRHHRGRPADRTRRQARRHPGRLPMDAGRAVLGRLGRLQHRPCPGPAGRSAGVRHGPHRPGPHHPPAHAAGRLATDDTRLNRTAGRTPGRLPSRTPAQAGRPLRARAATAGSSSTARRSIPSPGGLPSPAGGGADPDRRRPSPSGRRQRALRPAPPGRIHHRPDPHRPRQRPAPRLGWPASDTTQRPPRGGEHGKAATHRRGDSRDPRHRPQQGLRAAPGRRHPVGADWRLPAHPGAAIVDYVERLRREAAA